MIKNKTILALFGMGLGLIIVSAIMGFTGLPQDAAGPLVIRFDVASDQIDLLGGVGTFFGLLGIVAFILVVNFVLALEVYDKEQFLSYMIAAATLIVTFFFFVVASTITNIN